MNNMITELKWKLREKGVTWICKDAEIDFLIQDWIKETFEKDFCDSCGKRLPTTYMAYCCKCDDEREEKITGLEDEISKLKLENKALKTDLKSAEFNTQQYKDRVEQYKKCIDELKQSQKQSVKALFEGEQELKTLQKRWDELSASIIKQF